MKKGMFITLKVILTLIWIIGGLITLTEIKLVGFNIGSWKVSSEEVRMFVSPAGDYFFWVWIVIGIYIIWKKWIKKK